jgi:hypothetical protein
MFLTRAPESAECNSENVHYSDTPTTRVTGIDDEDEDEYETPNARHLSKRAGVHGVIGVQCVAGVRTNV